MKGKGWAGSTASGVRTGKICWKKWSSSQNSLRLLERRRIDESDLFGLEVLLQLAPQAELGFGKLRDAGVDERQLLFRQKPVIGRRLDPATDLADDAGDADHEEFVEIVRRDRNEAHPLQQGMGGVGGFQQHPAVEFEPR